MIANRLLPQTLSFLNKLNRNCSSRYLISVKNLNVNKTRTLQFSTSFKLNVKLFVDKENQYAHDILENSEKNYSILKDPENISGFKIIPNGSNLDEILSSAEAEKETLTTQQLVEHFKNIVINCKLTNTLISDDKFDQFIDLFTSHCLNLSDEELLECLQFVYILPETQSSRSKNFVELWNALDNACESRIDRWDTKQMLLVADYWYALNLAKNSEFVYSALQRIGRKIKKLSVEEMVQTMFLCNVTRKPLLGMFDFEVRFRNLIDGMTLKEIGVMSMGFFKTKTPIRNPEIIDKIYYRLMDEVETVEDITLVNILKILRYSSRIPQCDLMRETLDKLCTQIDRVSLLSCLHIALLGCDIQLCHQRCLEIIIKRFINSIDNARIKDMERICHVMALLDLKTESGIEKTLCSMILERIKFKVDEIIRYPRCFPCCLHYLGLCGFANDELIASVLEQKFIKHAYGNYYKIGREIFALNSFVQINRKDTYRGPYLLDKQKSMMGKLLQHYIPDRNSKYRLHHTDKLLLEVKDSVDSVFPISFMRHILPHFERPDILLLYDKSKKQAIPLSEEFPKHYSGEIITRDILLTGIEDPSNIIPVAILIGGWNNYVRDTDKLTGLFKMKVTQLEILGYKPIVVSWNKWRILNSESNRNKYIRKELLQICR